MSLAQPLPDGQQDMPESPDSGSSDYKPARPPTQDELPYSDGIPMDSPRHRWQMELLINSLEPWLDARYQETGEGAYIGGDMFVYFNIGQADKNEFRGPDVFIVLGVEPGERKSWVVWEEGKGPDIVIELLSTSTRTNDKTVKKDVYCQDLRVPEYYWYDPNNPDDFAGFTCRGREYEPLEPDAYGRLTSNCLGGLQLTRWSGRLHGIDATWLRWCTPEGELLRTAEEAAIERADRATERADRETERADRLAARLRALGIDPETLE